MIRKKGNRLVVSYWETRTLSEKKVIYGYIAPPLFRDRVNEDAPAPITHYPLTPLEDQSDPSIRYGLRWIFQRDKTDPIIPTLKIAFFKPTTLNDNGLTAHRKFTYTYNGKARTRYATQKEEEIPRIENYPYRKGVVYRFYYYAPAPLKQFTDTVDPLYRYAFNWLYGKRKTDPIIRRVKAVTSNKHVKRNTPYTIITDNLNKKRKRDMILYRLTATDEDHGISLILYDLKFKPHRALKEKTPNTFNARRVHHKKLKVIDYAHLMKSEKRISKKWFKLLLDAVKSDNPNTINTLPAHLQRLAHKVVTYTDIIPQPLKAVNT